MITTPAPTRRATATPAPTWPPGIGYGAESPQTVAPGGRAYVKLDLLPVVATCSFKVTYSDGSVVTLPTKTATFVSGTLQIEWTWTVPTNVYGKVVPSWSCYLPGPTVSGSTYFTIPAPPSPTPRFTITWQANPVSPGGWVDLAVHAIAFADCSAAYTWPAGRGTGTTDGFLLDQNGNNTIVWAVPADMALGTVTFTITCTKAFLVETTSGSLEIVAA